MALSSFSQAPFAQDVDAKTDADEDTCRRRCRIKRPTPTSAFHGRSSSTRTQQGWRRANRVALLALPLDGFTSACGGCVCVWATHFACGFGSVNGRVARGRRLECCCSFWCDCRQNRARCDVEHTGAREPAVVAVELPADDELVRLQTR